MTIGNPINLGEFMTGSSKLPEYEVKTRKVSYDQERAPKYNLPQYGNKRLPIIYNQNNISYQQAVNYSRN